MKPAVPQDMRVSGEAKEMVRESIVEFIEFIASEAADMVAAENRRVVTGDDLLAAMRKLGFDEYAEPLAAYLTQYRAVFNNKSSSHQKETQTTSPTEP